MIHRLTDLDIALISYDEPGADAHYSRLCTMIGRPVHRVHGITGIHAAHAEAARRSVTDRFVTVDGDNHVLDDFVHSEIEDGGVEDAIFSFKARNAINGLEYGNGGVKVWPKRLFDVVRTHETGEGVTSTDFCWSVRYMQIDRVLSEARADQSPMQAFRAGYREGVKMGLIGGEKLGSWAETRAAMYHPNYSRLMVWCCVGADVANGIWSMYGARLGFVDLWTDKIAIAFVSDYPALTAYLDRFLRSDPWDAVRRLGASMSSIVGADVPVLDAQTSAWVKSIYVNPPRAGLMFPTMPPVALP